MRNARSITLLLVAAAWLAGCATDDDPVTPTGGQFQVEADDAETYATDALEMVNEMTADIPELALGEFTAAKSFGAAGEPEWDAEEQAWILDDTAEFSEGDPAVAWGEYRLYVWIQFRGAEGPLPTPLGATVFEYRAVNGMTMHSETEQGTSDLAYDMATNLVVTYEESGYAVDGTGETVVEASHEGDGEAQNLRAEMAWNVDLAMPTGGCPSGTADVTMGQYRLDALYNGTSTVAWTLVGPGYQASGTDDLACGSGVTAMAP